MTTMGYFNPSKYAKTPKTAPPPYDGPPPAYQFSSTATTGTDNKDKEKEKPKEDTLNKSGKFLEHVVEADDDIVFLAVRYGVSVQEIRKYNRRAVFGDALTHLVGEILYIPLEGATPMSKVVTDPKTEKEQEFCKQTKATQEEAKFYLAEAEYDVAVAVKQFQTDMDWEKNGDKKKATGEMTVGAVNQRGKAVRYFEVDAASGNKKKTQTERTSTSPVRGE
jgi:hypothetical protein